VIDKIFSITIVVAVGYWYWQGPYQEKYHPSYETRLQKNAEDMALCMHGAAYREGATGVGSSSTNYSDVCAARLNLYQHQGGWHSYNDKRPNK
jgi:hypothetical protein